MLFNNFQDASWNKLTSHFSQTYSTFLQHSVHFFMATLKLMFKATLNESRRRELTSVSQKYKNKSNFKVVESIRCYIGSSLPWIIQHLEFNNFVVLISVFSRKKFLFVFRKESKNVNMYCHEENLITYVPNTLVLM